MKLKVHEILKSVNNTAFKILGPVLSAKFILDQKDFVRERLEIGALYINLFFLSGVSW